MSRDWEVQVQRTSTILLRSHVGRLCNLDLDTGTSLWSFDAQQKYCALGGGALDLLIPS